MRKSATIVASPRKTRMATFADELLSPFLPLAVAVGDGAELGEVTAGGALKRKVYEPVSGASVALRSV
jgi:hypothetical protein